MSKNWSFSFLYIYRHQQFGIITIAIILLPSNRMAKNMAISDCGGTTLTCVLKIMPLDFIGRDYCYKTVEVQVQVQKSQSLEKNHNHLRRRHRC